jgi:hypothetical protein
MVAADQWRGFGVQPVMSITSWCITGLIKAARNPFKGGTENRERPRPTTPTTPRQSMSTERELADKFGEALEARNIEIVLPYLAEDMTYEVLPSS